VKKLSVVIFSVVIILTVLFAGCGAPSTTSTAIGPAATQTQAPDKIKLKWATFIPPMADRFVFYKEFAEKLSKDTNGRVTIELFPAGSLLTEPDMISGINNSITDIGDIPVHVHGDKYPLHNILMLPCMFLGDQQTWMKIKGDLENKYPAMKAEIKDFKLIISGGTSGSYPIHTKSLVKLPADLKGLKIFATAVQADVFAEIGASPIALPLSDWYMSLERGIINAMDIDNNAIVEMKCSKFLNYHLDFPSGFTTGDLQADMNINTYSKLPADIQKAIDAMVPWATKRAQEVTDAAEIKAIGVMKSEKHTFTQLTPQEEQEWYKAAVKVHEKYLEKVQAMGLPARDIYNDALSLAKQYKQK
jgi:TRAP-type C4-dicarboxylate transport system substrate-binding protein